LLGWGRGPSSNAAREGALSAETMRRLDDLNHVARCSRHVHREQRATASRQRRGA
jgi:hypothetical protein